MISLKLKSVVTSIFVGSLLYAAPTQFSSFDKNSDGTISSSEFYQTQAEKMSKRAEEGRQMKNAANAASFESIDTNGDGKITESELNAYQQNRQSQKQSNKGQNKKSQTKEYNQGQGQGRGYGQGRGGGRGGGGGGGR